MIIVIVVVDVDVNFVVAFFLWKVENQSTWVKKPLEEGQEPTANSTHGKKNCIASMIQTQVILVRDKCLTTIPLLLPKMVPSTLV